MLTPPKYNTRALYFTDKLRESMGTFLEYPCTMMEAPMGYGKTTAAKEALRNLDAKVLWQNVYTSGATDFWAGFCSVLSELDSELADNLHQMELPMGSVWQREVIQLLHTINSDIPVFLVIDDYHFIRDSRVDEFMSFLVRHLPQFLHVIILTRMSFLNGNSELRLKGFVNYIGLDVLAFTPDDIAKYYRLCGVVTIESERDMLFSYSEGWISALYLFLLEYTSRGSFAPTRDIPTLVHQNVYDPLRDELKSFLNRICLFDMFSKEQVRHMWKHGNAERLLNDLLACNAFITCDRLTGEYHLHNIFSICVREEFDQLPQMEQREIWNCAADWYFDHSEYASSMEFYFKSKNFDQLLFAIEKDKGNSFSAENQTVMIQYFSECPDSIRFHHHLAMLIYSKRLFGFRQPELFQKICEETIKHIREDDSLSEEEKNNLIGEYEIIRSFACYNDIAGMSEHHRKACSLMTRASVIFDADSMWTFSSFSVLFMFYRESGMLTKHLHIMKEALPYYYQVTGGHGMGAEYVMEAETCYMGGDMENARIIAHTALVNAQSRNQWSVALCAEFLQVRIALFQGDYSFAATLLSQMRENLIRQKHYILLHTMDVCESAIYAQLGQTQNFPVWISQGNFANNKMLFPSVPSLHMVYGRILLEQKEYLKLIGQSELFLRTATIFPNLLTQIYLYIYLAAAYEQLGRRSHAVESLNKALNIAAADGLYLPFVENGKYLESLLWGTKHQQASEEFDQHAEFVTQCQKLYVAYFASIKAIRKEHFTDALASLTEREQEVAALAAKGLSNPQISKQLYITEHTVKAHLKNAFEKLGIKSRVQLNEYLLLKSSQNPEK
ncbi:helix-turn-helix transcriptional regulator [Faecalispora anaeroviscerum]|uniref:helix-turn-helix transcriptional regulator n=1 Tax=Faecalispora anaeroviscerum TaxID=2991836 RepID=UPI0024BAA04A|nr:LuxR C-terminal-related transcriptional regulator [Faecalispora anaeroviscerum]